MTFGHYQHGLNSCWFSSDERLCHTTIPLSHPVPQLSPAL